MFKLIKFLCIVVVVLGVAGYFLGWFEVSKAGDDSFTVKVNKDKIEEDTKKAGEAVKGVGEKVSERLKRKSVEGTVKSLNLPAGTLSVATEDGETVEVKVSTATEVKAGGADASPASLSLTNRIKVVFEEIDGVRTAVSIEVLG